MPFASGNKKTNNAYDQRVGASDNAVVVQNGGFIFNPGRALTNTTLSADPEPAAKPNWTLIAGIAAGALVLVMAFSSFTKK